MVPGVKWAVAVCAATLAYAHEARAISGFVYDDPAALAVRQNFVALGGVTVKLYRDGGDRMPSADDIIVATVTTSPAGAYSFPQTRSADYWVAIDSRSIPPRNAAAWAEQTFGPAGALCARQDGTSQPNYFEGACVGGKSAASDDPSSLGTSEHIALVSESDSRVNVDFAFSFNVVTSTVDGDRVQGSLRQFVANANAVNGANHMRFVPITPAPEQRDPIMGVPTRWWTIALASPLPELTDDGTVIDGTAHHLLSPASVTNIHPGRLGEAPTVQPQDRTIPLIEKPELELRVAGGDAVVCAARCGVRALAMHGASTGVVARSDARIEHVMIGASPDGVSATAGGVGVQIEQGVTIARHVLVTLQSRAGVIVAAGAKIDGERLDVNRCGAPETGGGIVLLSEGSTIRNSVISANPGAGIILGSLDGATPAHANTIDSSTISSNQAGVVFGAGSARNNITRNDIMWNRVGGVTSAPFGTTPPRENRVSANRFDENGLRPIILDLASQDPNSLSLGAESCERIANAPNNGISAPRLTDVRVQTDEMATRATIRGQACPGQTVEIYQSYVTSGIRDKQPDLPRIRGERNERETLTNQEREMILPSVGEFNYLGSTIAAADGTFEATFPLPVVKETDDPSRSLEETNIWANDVLRGASPSDRAFSAIAIDAAGNTSEMSVRRQVD